MPGIKALAAEGVCVRGAGEVMEGAGIKTLAAEGECASGGRAA